MAETKRKDWELDTVVARAFRHYVMVTRGDEVEELAPAAWTHFSHAYLLGFEACREQAAKATKEWFDSWRPCDCGADTGTKYNTQCGHAINCDSYTLHELLATLRALKPERGKIEEVLRNRILFIGGPEDTIPQVPTNKGVQVYTGCPNDLIKELYALGLERGVEEAAKEKK